MSRLIRVIVADDHPPTRAGVRIALEANGFEVCAEVGNAASAIEAARRELPDVCLLDIHMPGDGIHAAEEISRELPETAVVMLTVSRTDSDLFDALRAGASGYLLKDAELSEISAAIRAVAAGLCAVAPGIAGVLLEFVRSTPARPAERTPGASVALSPRERDVLTLLCQGCDNGDIARQLFVSASTVKHHVSRILEKIGASNRVQAATFAVRAGFYDGSPVSATGWSDRRAA